MTDIFIALFVLAMVANVIALIRHWQALRVFNITMNNLIATQKEFNEIVVNEQRKQRDAAMR